VLQLLVTAKVVPSWSILVTLMMEVIRSSEMSNLIRATRSHIPEEGTVQYISYIYTKNVIIIIIIIII
jgi:hypothetical protein